MRGFTSERRLPIRTAVEIRSPLNQFADIPWTFLGQGADGRRHTQTIAGGDGVAAMQSRRVVRANGCGNTALRVSGVALPRIRLGQDDDASRVGERDRRTQAGDAAADYEKVAADGHGAILSMPR